LQTISAGGKWIRTFRPAAREPRIPSIPRIAGDCRTGAMLAAACTAVIVEARRTAALCNLARARLSTRKDACPAAHRNRVFVAARPPRPSRDTLRRRAITRTLSGRSVPISARCGFWHLHAQPARNSPLLEGADLSVPSRALTARWPSATLSAITEFRVSPGRP